MKDKEEYWKQLNEEYSIPLSKEASDDELQEWYKEYRKQSINLMQKYGESAWHINDFANSLRNEDISESLFRSLVRMEMDKCFWRLKIERIKEKLIRESIKE